VCGQSEAIQQWQQSATSATHCWSPATTSFKSQNNQRPWADHTHTSNAIAALCLGEKQQRQQQQQHNSRTIIRPAARDVERITKDV
jgi:hypothetical protein